MGSSVNVSRREFTFGVAGVAAVAAAMAAARQARGADAAGANPGAAEGAARGSWTVGTPIVTYWAGPAMDEATVRQMADGGFNVVWCGEKDLDLLAKHGLRGMLQDPLLAPATLDDPAARQKLDALLGRVREHPALYAYFLTDEPPADALPALGRLVAHLRDRDPGRLAYINLLPTYATNEQLGTKGDTAAAYREYLRKFVADVKPALLSYDHYQFYKAGDTDQYFLNLTMVRDAAKAAGVPFLNIVQAAAWGPAVRVPTPDETRYLVYTTLAYGASGISYYVYYAPGHEGGIADAQGHPTPIYDTLKGLNREFVAVARELQPLNAEAVYHTSLREAGCVPPPGNAPFRVEPAAAGGKRGLALGLFGKGKGPTHALAVNLDSKADGEATLISTLIGPADLEVFDAATAQWVSAGGLKAELRLPPGGGKLVRTKAPESR